MEPGRRIRISTGKKTKAEALAFCLDQSGKGKLALDGYSAKSARRQPTFEEYASEWWEPSCRYVKEQALLGRKLTPLYCKRNKEATARWLVPFWGKKRLSTIQPGQIEAWLISLNADGLLSSKSANNIKGLLSVMLGQAVREGLLEENPCRKARSLSGKNKKERGILSLDEARLLFSSLLFHGQLGREHDGDDCEPVYRSHRNAERYFHVPRRCSKYFEHVIRSFPNSKYKNAKFCNQFCPLVFKKSDILGV